MSSPSREVAHQWRHVLEQRAEIALRDQSGVLLRMMPHDDGERLAEMVDVMLRQPLGLARDGLRARQLATDAGVVAAVDGIDHERAEPTNHALELRDFAPVGAAHGGEQDALGLDRQALDPLARGSRRLLGIRDQRRHHFFSSTPASSTKPITLFARRSSSAWPNRCATFSRCSARKRSSSPCVRDSRRFPRVDSHASAAVTFFALPPASPPPVAPLPFASPPAPGLPFFPFLPFWPFCPFAPGSCGCAMFSSVCSD